MFRKANLNVKNLNFFEEHFKADLWYLEQWLGALMMFKNRVTNLGGLLAK